MRYVFDEFIMAELVIPCSLCYVETTVKNIFVILL